MELRRKLIINGVEFHLAVSQTGKGVPTADTAGLPGVLYMDEDTGDLYKCIAADDGVYNWKPVFESNTEIRITNVYEISSTGDRRSGVNIAGPKIVNEDGTVTLNSATVWDGTDGITPHIGENGNWFVGETDTGVAAGGNGSGGNVDYVGVEPAEDDIPQVYLTGVDGVSAPTTKAEGEVNFRLHYVSKSEEFTAYCTLKLQGDSSASASYKKKNYTVKMFSDAAHESKLKKEFRDWGFSTNKYILKANWIDATHARQMVAYDIWSKIVQTREGYADSVEATLPNQGTSDGFPVVVYINDTYYGIYNWILPKSDTLFGVDEDDPNQFVLYGQLNTDGTYRKTANNFRALWSGVDVDNWEIEVGTNSDIVKTALNDFIGFVMTATDEEFYANLNNYCDVNTLIDDYLYEYYICGIDALAQNMILICRDGKRFTMGVWDRDSTFGLWWNGASMVSATYRCPEDYQEKFSLLWARLEGTFYNELKARKAELRADGAPLSFANIVGTFDKFVHNIGDDRYDENNAAYTQPSKSIATKKQFREFVRDRLAYVDSCVDAFGTVIKCADISLSESAVEISEGNHTLTAVLVPSTTTQEITWESSNTSIATVSGGVITPLALGSTTITAKCGQYSATCAVTVSGIAEIPCTGINLDKSTLTFTAEGTQTITATATPVGCTDAMVWVSSNPSVAAISVNGVVCTVEAITNGNATITVTCGEYSASCDVSVSGIAEPVPCTGISLDKTELTFNGDGTKTITATVTPSDTTDIVVWSVNPAGIVSVANGVVTALANGSCTITATCGEQSATCTVSVSGIGEQGGEEDTEIDYTLNPLDGVTWSAGKYDKNTGEPLTATADYCTGKFSLQQCVYDFQSGTGNNWGAIWIWDENDNYIGCSEVQASIGKFVANPNWKYAIKVANSSAFDESTVSLMPVDQSANAASVSTVTIEGASATWNDSTYGAELDITDKLTAAGYSSDIFSKINTCSHFVFASSTAGQAFELKQDVPILHIATWQGKHLLVANDITAADAPGIVGTVTIN